jgi:hypothetical protein
MHTGVPTPEGGPARQCKDGLCHTLCLFGGADTLATPLGMKECRDTVTRVHNPWLPWLAPSGTTLHASSIAVSQACEHTVGTGPDLERWEAVEPAYVITSHEGPRIKLRAF